MTSYKLLTDQQTIFFLSGLESKTISTFNHFGDYVQYENVDMSD